MYRLLLICLSMLLIAAPAADAAAAPALIAVRASASVTGKEILLGDIAEIQCGDAQRTADLRALKIGNAAAPGGKVVLSPALLNLRLASAGLDYEGITLDVPDAVTVETEAQPISSARLIAEATAHIAAQMKLETRQNRYTLEVLAAPNNLVTAVGETVFEVKLPYGIKYHMPTNVEIWLYVDGRLYKKVQFRVRLHIYEQVVVTSRSLLPKEVISDADLHLEDMDTSNLAPGYLTDVGRAVGLVMKRVVNQGVVVTSVMLDQPIVIQRMAIVRIVSNIGGVTVKMEGQALQDGKAGELIRVKNISSKKSVVGRVIDESTVEVIMH